MKKRTPPKHPGEALKRARLKAEIPKQTMVLRLGVTKELFTDIEAWNLEKFPPKAYLLPLLKKYCRAVEVDFKKLEENFPDAFKRPKEVAPKRKPKAYKDKQPVVLSSLSKYLIVAVFLFIAFGYVFWQSQVLNRGPEVNITSHMDESIVDTELIVLEGITDTETQVFINGSNVLVANNGTFDQPIQLQPGLNSINISAVNKLGRETNKELRIVWQ